MSHTKKPTIEKIILALLGLLALAALVRTMFLGLEIDEEYALSLGFRLVRGDRLFYSMWEPHQLAALPPAGMMISSFLSPALCRRVEMGVLLSGSLILLALATIASCMTTDMTLLLLPRLLTGLASGVIIVLGESWITGGAAGSQRATLTGLYASAFTGCQLAGPLLISVGPAWQTSALIAIVAVTAVCLLMLRHLPTGTRESLGERASWRSLGAFLPVLASGVFCFAFFDASILALLPLYGMDKGLNEGLAVLLVTEARHRLRSKAIPKAFRGLPITLVYIGVLALAIYGFTGHSVIL